MNLRHLSRLDRVVRLAVAFDAADSDGETTFELPEDLTALSDEELETLRQEAVNLFKEVRGEGKNVSDADLKVLKGLSKARKEIEAEQSNRAEASKANNAEADALAAELEADENGDGDGDADGDGDGDAGSDDGDAGDGDGESQESIAAAGETDALVAAGGKRRIVMPTRKRKLPVQETKAKSPITAVYTNGDVAHGAELDMDALTDLVMKQAGTLSKGAAQSKVRSGQAFSTRYPIARITKTFDSKAVVTTDDPRDIDAAIRWATDEKRLTGGNLVAAGGWCSPSETIYDLCQLESTDGIISLPELNPARGGVKNTLGPDWASFIDDTGFCFTEADDEASNYSLTDEINLLQEGGSGLTSWTITVNGQTTGAIDDDADAATVQAALEALSNVAPGDVVVSGTAAPIDMRLEWGGALAGTNVAVSTTPTGGTGVVNVVTIQAGGASGGPKPCNTVECPDFVDNRLDVCGVCINAGILLDRSYPELIRRYVSGAVTAHMHRVAANVIADMISGSTAVTVGGSDPSPGTAAPVLAAVELQVEAIKNAYRMARGVSLEAVFPFWIRGAIRADLSRRLGVNLLDVSDAMISGWFADRGVNAQFVYNFDGLALNPTAWPLTVRFLLYPAGTWVKLGGDVITLDNLHDSTLNERNNYTAIFTEEAWGVMKTCHVSRIVTVNICVSGTTAAGQELICAVP